MNKGISVIIRNKNESEYIGLAIQSVIDHLDGIEKEIIICDNESTDDSLYVVSLFNDRVPIKTLTIPTKNYTPGLALNVGINAAQYSTVLVLSAHCQITNVLISYLKDWANEPHFGAIFGMQTPIYRGKKINRRYVWENFKQDHDEINMISESEKRPFLHNAFCFYDRTVVLDNPFDETLSGKEDRYWADKYINNGGQILYSSDFECNHFYTGNGATWKGLG